ncbi:MAG: DEAD/DEAH box helicase family protein, partial [Deltaproteobacteria bacterium]|nr:DEAD/DEAH box helicase family protein [Deltaproteobacteria bacterium]
RLYEADSDLAQHFVIIAPNLTVYERLKDDFENCAIFYNDPLLPEEWKSDFQMQVVLQDEPGGASTTGTVYLTNIHRLYESRGNNGENEGDGGIFGPPVKRGQALHTGEELRKRITRHPTIMVLNDEAHHLHDPDLAWNRAIDALHNQSISRGNAGICLQLDFTATPKHNDGELFRHIICDFPLGEAVDAGIVKVPVLGEAEELQWQVKRDKNVPAHVHYNMNLKLGYQRYEKTYEEWNKTRKPILFVMTEDARAANEIADYLDSDLFPLIKGKVLNIHTRLKGKVKTYMRCGREVKEFVENETAMKPDDLRFLREMSRDLDAKHSKFRCVVSVMMLREGWDVRNVTTIVPLRPYSAKSGILPEQTLGRGLRRMIPLGEIPEMVTVVHHPAFRKLYEEELAQEGLDIAVLPVREVYKQTVTIFVDHKNKPVEDLEIEIPTVTDSIETTAELPDLSLDEVRDYFKKHFQPLPVGKRKEGPVEYKERHLFTDEIISRMQLDGGLLNNAWSAAGYFAQLIGRACKISNPHRVLTPIVEDFLSKVLFEREVDLYSGEVDHRMRDIDVQEHMRATFTPVILSKVIREKKRKRISKGQRLSTWKPFQATSTDKRPASKADRTMFNLVPCDNEFEQSFADFCDIAKDIAAFAKNAGPQKLMIDYLKPDGHRALYVPDFFVRLSDDNYLLVELKGKVDSLVPLKARAAVEWCKVASGKEIKWQYLYVPYHLFQQAAPATIAELSRSCEPSLKALIQEAEKNQEELALEEETTKKEFADLFSKVIKQAGLDKAPDPVADVIRQAVDTLDYAIRSKHPSLGIAFQPLLAPFDRYSLQILVNRISSKIPGDQIKRDEYFNPYLDNVSYKERNQLEKYQRHLKSNLIFGRKLQCLGTLLFCLEYANDGLDAPGIWKDVRSELRTPEMASLYSELTQVNRLRNLKIAHGEEQLTDPECDA